MCKFNLKVLFLIAQLFICYLITLVWYAWPRGRSFSVGNFINHMQIQLKFQDLYLYSFTFSKAGNVSGPGQLWSRGLFDGCGLNPTGSHKDNCNIITVVWLGNICKHCILFISRACERCNCITFMQGPTLHVLYRVHLYLQHFPAVNNLKIL